jgi:hypothetical protein
MLIVNFVDGADVRMIQCRCCLGFALKAAECLRVFGYLVGQELRGDEATEFDILSLVDDTHPATTEFLDDAVMREGIVVAVMNFCSLTHGLLSIIGSHVN